MHKRCLLLLSIIISLLFTAGCWDYIEYDKIAQLSGLGFDFNPATRELTITALYAAPKRGGSSTETAGGSKAPTNVRSATDATIMGALTKLQEVVPRKMFYGYLDVVIIGKEAATYQLKNILDLLDRSPAVQNSAKIMIASGKAEDMLALDLATDTINPMEKSHNLADLTSYTGAAYSVSIADFQQMLAIAGWEATAPHLTFAPGSKNQDKPGETADNIRIDKKTSGTPRIEGLAVFKQDNLAGFLTHKESLGFNWITGQTIKSYIVSGEADNAVFYHINNSSSKIKVKIENDRPIIYLTVNVYANLRKYYDQTETDYITPEIITQLEQSLAEVIQSDIDDALYAAKSFNSDIFGFGFALFRSSPRLWQEKYQSDWDNIFPQLQVNTQINVKITNTGTNIKNFIIK